jgi:hypothetical protein
VTNSLIRSITRGLAARLVLAAALCASCYSPKITDGGYLCNTQLDPSCPSGFHCNAKYCIRDGSNKIVDAAVDPPSSVETNPSLDAPVEKPVAEAGHDAPTELACFQPPATCTAAAGLKCDPVCQKGCGCREKCAVVNGALACMTPFGSLGAVGDACTTATDGSDNCAPGLTCLNDGCGSRCYTYCRVDQDCPTSACNRDAGGGQMVCDVPYVTCHPIKDPMTAWGCPLQNEGCYLSPTVGDRTYCDCPFGAGGIGASCKLSRQCDAGLVCIDPTGGNNFQCHQVCPLGSASTCIGGGSCLSLNGSAKYGFCN